ncbi:hypothetical protein V2J09_002491 [Rumex salicifolius]
MMMQISSTLPSQNLNSFHLKRVGFQCRASPLNPATDKTKIHLSNLDKLLQKQPESAQSQVQISNRQPVRPAETRRGGILQGLNLPWPPGNINKQATPPSTDEIMSPGNLNRLRRLLSMTAEYSPRNHIAGRWREYHGAHDWAGLLDPLDENLRREVVRYGEFVQGAYRAFNSDPATSSDGSHPDVALSDRSYKVTKNLYATSSVGLPKWVDDVAPDLGWMTQRSSWIGYVAVCDDPHEISRMGRRDIVISLRGTATCLEWAENLRDVLVRVPDSTDPNPAHKPKVECGFLSLFKTRGEHVGSLAESVTTEIQKLMQQYRNEELSITITGHSLGAALALLVADEVTGACGPHAPPVAVFSFGGPRVGNRAFAQKLESKNVKVLRIVNKQDLITRVPGMFVSEELDQKLRSEPVTSGVMSVLDGNLPWSYSHVGAELRVDTKASPYLKPDADVACCHDLEAYLHLVDGYSGSDCPFRANAKRSLVKLLSEQGSNVKKLYTSKAKSLSRLNVEKDYYQEFVMAQSCLSSPSN